MPFITDEVLVHFSGARDGTRGSVAGTSLTSRYNQPLDILIDSDDEFAYVACYGDYSVRKVDLDTGASTVFTSNLPGSPVHLYLDGEMIMVSCIGPANPNWTAPIPYTEVEITEIEFGNPVPVIEAHVQDEFDNNARWAAQPGDLSDVPRSLNAHPGPRFMLCFFPDGSLDWMRAHGNLNEGPFSTNGLDGSFLGESAVSNITTKEGDIGGWVIRARNSGRPFNGSSILNFRSVLGVMEGYSGYKDAAYFRPEAARTHCYATNVPCTPSCEPINPTDPILPYEFYLRGDAAEPARGWPGACTQWPSATFIGVWSNVTSYADDEAVTHSGRSWVWVASYTTSTVGVNPPSNLGPTAWVLVVSPGAPAWSALSAYSRGSVRSFGGDEYEWMGAPISSTAGDEPGVNSHWVVDFPCAKLARDIHDHDGPADLTHSIWQDMSADADWCSAYNAGGSWVDYHGRSCNSPPGFYEPPFNKNLPCPPPLAPPPPPGFSYYYDLTNDRDGAYAGDVGMALVDGRRVRFAAYVYPSDAGLITSPRDPESYCVEAANPGPARLLPAAITWSDATPGTDFTARMNGFAPWNGFASWQMAVGQTILGPGWEMGGSMHRSSQGMLQTWDYFDPENVGTATFRGQTEMPVRGLAYSPSRDLWYFTTSASSGSYGPYTKEVNGFRSGVGFHQIMTLVPFVEVNPTALYHLGEFSASIEEASDDTTTGIFVGCHIEMHAPTVSPLAGIIDTGDGYALNGGGVVPEPGFVEPPAQPDQFVPEINPLPPATEAEEVPLPPWIPDPGPHRES